jgi:type I restriction enzyme S subunit
MRLNYKPIGDYVNLVEERNKELQDLPLIGLSITKQFIPSIANTIGTDMSTYRTIYKNQFAYSAVTSRNGDKLTIALFKDLEKGLISQAYTPFEITDTNKLLPEYLMMWFSRPEFDRYARFKSHGSARELFSWEDLCQSLMPVPSIDKQKEIVAEYNTNQNRIDLNKQLIQKLEETAQAIYKEWFVENQTNELTTLNEYVGTNPKLELRKNKKAAYIEMADLSETSMSINGMTYRDYIGGSKFQNNDTLLARITPCLENGKTAFVNILNDEEIAAGSTEFIVMRAKKNVSPFWVYCLAREDKFRAYAISSMVGSSGRQRVHEKYLEVYELPKVDDDLMMKFHISVIPIFEMIKLKSQENQRLSELKESLLSKLATVENFKTEIVEKQK